MIRVQELIEELQTFDPTELVTGHLDFVYSQDEISIPRGYEPIRRLRASYAYQAK